MRARLVAFNRSLAQPPQPAADVVCETLMADYILKRGKIESADIDAAVQLIASRGRSGYWRTVLQHYQKDPDNRHLRDDVPSFYAAVGLANLGEEAGFQWLLGDHLGDTPDLEARLQALSELTGEQNRPLEQWRDWWRDNAQGDQFAPKSRAILQRRP